MFQLDAPFSRKMWYLTSAILPGSTVGTHLKDYYTIMHEKSINTLEYPKILAKVAQEAAFSASKELVMELTPTPNLEEARRRLAYTSEAYHLLDLQANVSVRGAH